jgi:hypothetical protein
MKHNVSPTKVLQQVIVVADVGNHKRDPLQHVREVGSLARKEVVDDHDLRVR